MDKQPAAYILASQRNGTLYIGVTSDLTGRVSVHKQGLTDGFSKQYKVTKLVHCEFHDTMEAAIAREKQLKKWPRARKLELINGSNPLWRDLYTELTGLIDPTTMKAIQK